MKKLFLTLAMAVLFLGGVYAKGNEIPLIGSKAPSFTAKSTNGKVTFPGDFGKSWKIIFSHPQDFTPVCSSEILELAYMQNDFEMMGVKIAIISTDDLKQHNRWKSHLETLDYKGRGKQKIDFPIFQDLEATISKKYGMLHKPISTTKDVRGVFIIDSENIVRSINFYPMQVGRNMEEIKRIVTALQTTDNARVVTPANWNNGDDVMVPFFPYSEQEIANNPGLKDEFYNIGGYMWFKKENK
ncbi:MAG: redoxin domain-containing protein [Prolixibacteraceae bacterium]|jgi:peroxiredoxin 2/4|nr:redoxin domain-containing protein [Prolixibacteraceae bacterium]MBT6766509.1 redoxin domain-containing protein [Prolixibacteraceae bacterium]MBT6997146.1 redoxin domain-containing protein [Prolixibacteraceae bacterium]MBT7393321.1 redoxin domain-containing protein [Prolixibacteraceae bacterium]